MKLNLPTKVGIAFVVFEIFKALVFLLGCYLIGR